MFTHNCTIAFNWPIYEKQSGQTSTGVCGGILTICVFIWTETFLFKTVLV